MRQTTITALGLMLIGLQPMAADEQALHTPYRAGVNSQPQPVVAGKTARPMRYQPADGGFAITNGTERFNRPLYIGHDGARFDAGDRPEFALYLPGKGGVLRLGTVVERKAKWLQDAETVMATYREGRMIYEISDPLFGGGRVVVEAVPAANKPGAAMVQVRCEGGPAVELVWAFGGATGVTDFRGDIGYTDVAKHYGLKAADCKDATIQVLDNRFVLRRDKTVVTGVFSTANKMQLADAAQWDEPTSLLESTGGGQPVVVGRIPLETGNPVFLLLARGEVAAMSGPEMETLFQQSVESKRAIANHISVKTPDPYVNALVPALNIAADALWDGQSRFAHGNVAWRRSYFGWQPAYTGDALGWPDRTRTHTKFCFSKQMVQQGPGEPPVTFKSDGYFHEDHGRIYNWNPVVVDVLMRHLKWTGDLEFARESWPYLKRHLAREKRLFDRDGLYDAVVAIWASDALSYNGGGVAHTSAYNFYHNKMAAEIARKIGEDPAPYEAEAAHIANAMQERLWLPERGSYAEYRDTWGEKKAHPAAALWTAYHAIDSEVPDAFQAWQVGRSIETGLPQIPVHGPGVPEGDWKITSTSTWMPYIWSINVVAAGELYNAALACWEAGRRDQAWSLFMGTALENMFRGICPGNVGMTLSFDGYSGERIRDFGFIGNMSRAVTEGLFGIRPNLLENEVTVRPGWPGEWEFASFKHPSIAVEFERKADEDYYRIAPAFGRPVKVNLVVPARGLTLKATVNGQAVQAQNVDDAIGSPLARIGVPESGAASEIVLTWSGSAPAVAADGTAPIVPPAKGSGKGEASSAAVPVPPVVATGESFAVSTGEATVLEIKDPQRAFDQVFPSGKGFAAKAAPQPGHRTAFAKVNQGEWTWWIPVEFESRPALEIVTGADGRATPRDESGALRFRIRNNSAGRIKTTATVSTGEWKQSLPVDIAGGGGVSEEITIAPENLLPGSQSVQVVAAGRTADGLVVNWGIPAAANRFRAISLKDVFNARVTEIFEDGKYVRKEFPAATLQKFDLVDARPDVPGVTLAIPSSGLGGWIHPDGWEQFKKVGGINDKGLRAKAASQGGIFRLDCGVPFEIPPDETSQNIALTSQWDVYPKDLTVPLAGRARHAYLLMAGSTYHMQSRFENGEFIIAYTDGTEEKLSLRNPETWWPIHRDYFVDDFAFQIQAPRPPRVRLDSGTEYFGATTYAGGTLSQIESHLIAGGAATVLDLPLDPKRELKSLTLRATANEVVIGLMAVTLAE